nr:uncharacterized protein LOC112723997 [Arachis hypogaea]
MSAIRGAAESIAVEAMPSQKEPEEGDEPETRAEGRRRRCASRRRRRSCSVVAAILWSRVANAERWRKRTHERSRCFWVAFLPPSLSGTGFREGSVDVVPVPSCVPFVATAVSKVYRCYRSLCRHGYCHWSR